MSACAISATNASLRLGSSAIGGATTLSSPRTAASRSCSTRPPPFRAFARRRQAIAPAGRLGGRQVSLEKLGEIQQRSHADHSLGGQAQLARFRGQHPARDLQSPASGICDRDSPTVRRPRCRDDLELTPAEGVKPIVNRDSPTMGITCGGSGIPTCISSPPTLAECRTARGVPCRSGTACGS